MFVALTIIRQPSEGIFSKLKGILSRPKTWVEIREYNNISYAVITAEHGRDGPDWEEIEWLAREHSRWLLLPEAEALPLQSLLRRYDSSRFDRKVLLHTACALVDRTRMPMYRRVLGLLDQDGSCADMLPQLLRHYTAVKVVTKNLTRYRFASEQMMQELGAPVMVDSSLSGLSDCVLALCPLPFASEEDARLPCPVLTGADCSLRYRYDALTGLEVSPPSSVPPPEGISPHLFAGALHELCGVEEVELTAQKMLCNHKISTLDEAVQLLLAAANHSIY